MDKLDQEIAAKQDLMQRLRRQLENAEVELRALQRAAELRPPVANVVMAPAAASVATNKALERVLHRGGRQPGSITKKWRQVLALWVAPDQNDNRLLDYDGVHLLQAPLLGLAPSSTKERVKQYRDLEYLVEEDGKFKVSRLAIEKFNLLDLRNEKGPTAIAEGPSMNGATSVSHLSPENTH